MLLKFWVNWIEKEIGGLGDLILAAGLGLGEYYGLVVVFGFGGVLDWK